MQPYQSDIAIHTRYTISKNLDMPFPQMKPISDWEIIK